MLQTKNRILLPALILALSFSGVPIMAQALYKKGVIETTLSEPEKVTDIKEETIKQITMSEVIRKHPYTGFKWENGTWKYLDEDKVLRNTFLVKNGKLYHFDEEGDRTTRWFHDHNGQIYFF